MQFGVGLSWVQCIEWFIRLIRIDVGAQWGRSEEPAGISEIIKDATICVPSIIIKTISRMASSLMINPADLFLPAGANQPFVRLLEYLDDYMPEYCSRAWPVGAFNRFIFEIKSSFDFELPSYLFTEL